MIVLLVFSSVLLGHNQESLLKIVLKTQYEKQLWTQEFLTSHIMFFTYLISYVLL